MKTDQLALHDLIYKIIVNRYPTIASIYFFGSYATGVASEKSDIDIIAISLVDLQPFQENFFDSGYLFDVLIFDSESLHGALYESKTSGNFSLVNGMLEAVTLPEKSELSEKLVSAAKKIKMEGYQPTEASSSKQRAYIKMLIDELGCISSDEELLLISINLYRALMSSALIKAGEGMPQNKHAIRAMKLKAPRYFCELNESFRASMSGDSSNLITMANTCLSGLGGGQSHKFRINLRQPKRKAW